MIITIITIIILYNYICSFEKAIRGTINWRADYKINDIDTSKIRHILDSNLTYIADKKDKYNRAILYFKGGYNIFKESTENYLSTVMYTIERLLHFLL